MTKDYRPKTIAAHEGDTPAAWQGAVAPPIYETSLFTFPTFEAAQAAFQGAADVYIYTRGWNPTARLAEQKIAALEGGEACKVFASGMAAVSSALLRFLRQGDHVVAVRSLYSVTYRFLREFAPRYGISHTFVDGRDLDEIAAAIRPNTRILYLESPTSLTFDLQDLAVCAAAARERGIISIVDNSWATPIFQRPIQLGIDVVVHSASKYLSGHSDVVAGALIASKKIVDEVVRHEHAILGGNIGPFEAWLLVRGLRTLPIRMSAHQTTAITVAGFLQAHPRVRKVYYPGLPSHPQYELGRRQMSGTSGLLSMELDANLAGVRAFTNALRVFAIGVSWGGYESLALPIAVTDVDPEERGYPLSMIRLHIGLEEPEALIDDLDQALRAW
ncbi:MAG TPA: aminotransferase class I/II-fold pyridoxal phosphate-dependent enzyme [bacterium]|nr:aminotransferase class I/II-fold pyridoxal phosphate-dependent enzyme [bacterium]